MGEVYRATDSVLKRQVAIKVLPQSLATDRERLARFQREAEVLASLNHTNIAHIYGLERNGTTNALVMELVEGPTLADRIAEGPMSVEEALRVAKQIAEALEAAHERGIIHRDLKPANVKIRPDGTVKVLDFGLAKAIEPFGSGDAVSVSPTITSPAMTQAGIILGTAAYMSPEQARGKPVDKRSDVWSFGCVLFEMLTARRAFDGDNTTDVLSAVTRIDPDWAALPTQLPAAIVMLLQGSLAKDPRQRIGDMGTARFVIDRADALTSRGLAPADAVAIAARASREAAHLWRRRAVMIGAVGFVFGAAAGIGAWITRPAAAPPVTRATAILSASLKLSGLGVAFSPDGRVLAIPAGDRLVLRRLDRDEVTTLAGTEGATLPFYSPDGQWVGFAIENALRKVRVDGSSPVPATIAAGVGIITGRSWWAADGTIIFGTLADGLFRVPADGGTPQRLSTPLREAGEVAHSEPQLLPGGRAILFSLLAGSGTTAAVLATDTGKWRTLPQVKGDGATYLASGHIAFLAGNTLLAAPFDIDARGVTGAPVPMANGVGSSFAVSVDGTLAFRPHAADRSPLTVQGSIVVADRKGTMTKVAPETTVTVESGGGLSFGPDSSRFLATLRDDPVSPAHIWLYDVARPGTRVRLTDQGFIHGWPTWAFDGMRFAFVSTREPMGIYIQQVSPGAMATLARRRTGAIEFPQSWAPDGSILFNVVNTQTGMDIGVVDSKGVTSMLLQTTATETRATVSADGRWLAYQSDASGQLEVYVRPFRREGRTEIVSSGGGAEPRWTDANELVYRRGPQVIAVPVAGSEDQIKLGEPQLLFTVDNDHVIHYDVSPDGKKFLLLQRLADAADTPLDRVHLVLNWVDELKERVTR